MTTLEKSKPADEARDSMPRSGDVSSCNDLLSVRLTHLDLFSGIGGFALAAQAAGFVTVGYVEKEPYAQRILIERFGATLADAEHNGPPAAAVGTNNGQCENGRRWSRLSEGSCPAIHADIFGVSGHEYAGVHLITGGFPCQPYSTAGKRAGSADDRALWPEMCRVIDEARPAFVLGENVPGIISMELDRVLDDLERLGYSAWPLAVPACAVDARHRRQRIWIVAYSEHERRHAAALNGKPASDDRGQTESQEQAKQPPGNHLLADAEKPGLERPVTTRPTRTDGRAAQCYRWPTEPGMGRVADGIPNRAHRLRVLGNAIVPQVAETLIREMARTLNVPDQRPGESPKTL